jgi:hypothetical protein
VVDGGLLGRSVEMNLVISANLLRERIWCYWTMM